MNLDQLRAFVMLAERRTFTEAAHRLGLSQPTLSRQVQALEEELGAKLLVRTPRGVALTDSGARFLSRAREAVEVLRQGSEELHELASLPRGPVAIGVLPTVGAYALPEVLGTFVGQFKQVQLRLVEAHADGLEEKVAEGELDLVITTLPLHRLELVSQKLWSEPFRLVVPRGHRLARGRKPVALAEVVGEPQVVVPGSAAEAALRAAADQSGQELRVGIEVDHAESQRRMVERGVGVALLPAIMLRDHQAGLCEVVDVRDGPKRTVALVHRGQGTLTYGARALKRFILERLKS
ncbi:MAG TPA: LysR family transcriptional regulator [Myxococcales bacterium]|nr:LysR family transcriptional regulator [Myxococcales bacterium]